MKMIFKKAIPRRTFLRGVGTAIALPLLDGMVPAFAGPTDTAAKPVVRLAVIYGPNGRIMNHWTPTAEGAAFDMTPTLEPLTPFRDQLLVLNGLDVKAADARGNEGGGVHARPCAAYLTGIHPKPNSAVGISVDQLIAKEFSKYTQVGSLELTMESSDIVGVDAMLGHQHGTAGALPGQSGQKSRVAGGDGVVHLGFRYWCEEQPQNR